MNDQTLNFLSRLAPFSFLGESEIEKIASQVTLAYHPRNTTIFTQGLSKIEALFIIKNGGAEHFFEEDDYKIDGVLLSEGGLFGGISMLVNNSVSIRSLKTTEDTHFYLFPKAFFLDICKNNVQFLEFFTDSFGKRMLDRSYAAIVAKTIQPGAETLQFLNQPVSRISQKRLISCNTATTIQSAADMMSRNNCSSILVTSPEAGFVGIVTDHDLRQKVVASRLDIDNPVEKIMSFPLRTVSSHALIFEALLTMMQENIKYLGITGSEEEVIGILTNRDILLAQGQSPLFLVGEIATADTINALQQLYQQLPGVIQTLIAHGAKAQNLNRMITTISEAILQKIIAIAIHEHGPPPCPFAFMVMGSEGRKEQTLKTDQDNAIIYEDVSGDQKVAVHTYFIALGKTICTALNAVGYDFCRGDIMAQNEKWCQPLAVWKDYFRSWIRFASPEDLLNSTIFFDLRCAHGHAPLVAELHIYLMERLAEWPLFLGYLAENAQHFKPPLGFFKNFIVESKGEHRDTFDIKKVMVPIIDYARIYTLKHGLSETNTQERLHQLYKRKLLSPETYHEMEQAYSFLMQLRFARQINAIMAENSAPDNHINPKKLTRIEQTMLKEIFSRIEHIQKEILVRIGDQRAYG
ncbi:MAG: CBS domain-containing protein [Proteobacteria bacterium]|nr:CBS domain-containing protein [Pseudomonadota bacterium]